ncbi:ATP-binding protein [Nocardia sp. CA2R105]|uniref:HD domain-containing protein n=1 Tax=Nocardia coffeae TaxID=2873381 RepID=UPI001CA63CF3|nr:ATP-binding protein [Nocardia coffeae]MBY8859286.1 ATP-binding protein [Nocardia coffeae]
MEIKLSTNAEKRAKKAQDLEAFKGINLLGIKNGVADLASLIGRDSIFGEYTKHDISHVDAMLEMLDWLIQPDEIDALSDADWLMLVLGIYFHDLGMLVTTKEYDERSTSDYPRYRETNLLTSDRVGRDYKHKQSEFGEQESEKFLYQEFVRDKHAIRIREWLSGIDSRINGFATEQAIAVRELVAGLEENFLDDLGLICESHHLNDLDDTGKYRVRRRYGRTDKESVNLQYIAVMLRTADLLHVSRDRTPSLSFRMINPTNPVSNTEWVKQMAVISITGQYAKDRDGNQDPDLERDTVEVHADFTNPEGYFRLTSYLDYAGKELQQSYKWISESKKKYGFHHKFSWRYIDDSNVSAKGFLAEQFSFELDQYKILELLTGHTLYNDTNVVVREIAQNAIDAVRLQHADETGNALADMGTVEIHWDTANRTLTVRDNGTGMSQDIIENNFLKVGASRYQEAKFKERYPDFSPISRFGIGVLSAFMIADSVEITTSHPDDEKARHLSLRDVHGKYLIRLLQKDSTDVPKLIAAHGTEVKMSIRASADLKNVPAIAASYFVIPRCSLTVQVDNQPAVSIGGESLNEILVDLLRSKGLRDQLDSGQIQVRNYSPRGLTVAYAVRWQPYFRQWELLHVNENVRSTELGICVEGVRVSGGTPGFEGIVVYAIANASGPGAPRTNVARSALDDTPQFAETLSGIYSAYCRHINAEADVLHAERGFSKSWASTEVRFMCENLFRVRQERDSRVSRESLALNEIRKLPMYVVDDGDERSIASLADLAERDEYFSIESSLTRYANYLARELPVDVPLERIVSTANLEEFPLPKGPILETGTGYASRLLTDEWEVSGIFADLRSRRLDFRWSKQIPEAPLWIRHPNINTRTLEWANLFRGIRASVDGRRRVDVPLNMLVPTGNIELDGLDEYDIVASGGRGIYLLPNGPWTELFRKVESNTGSNLAAFEITTTVVDLIMRFQQEREHMIRRGVSSDTNSFIKEFFEGPEIDPYAEVITSLAESGIRIFSLDRWRRSGPWSEAADEYR